MALAHGHQNNQAVFVLKGKPLNVWDLKRDVMYHFMKSLSVGDKTGGLRYDKVILANDADVDGVHSASHLSPVILLGDFRRVFISSKPARTLS
jgi:DNA gyrase/topoisomerase IV subunit B